MAQARVHEAWNHTAAVQAQLANMLNDFTKNPAGYGLKDFHPYLMPSLAEAKEISERQRAAENFIKSIRRIESAPEELVPKIAEEFLKRGVRFGDQGGESSN